MGRRSVLSASIAALSTPLAGCLGGSTNPGETDGGADSLDLTGRAPRDEPPSSSYPDYGRDVVRTIGYEAIDPDETTSYLEPSTRTTEPGEPIAFALENGSDETLMINFYAWRIDVRADGEWFRAAPREWYTPLMKIEPGDSHTWSITVQNDAVEAGDPVRWASGEEAVTVHALGGGHYAFGASGWFEGETHEEQTAFAARFELDADPLALTPTNAIEEIEWNDGTLVAVSDRGDPDEHRLGAYELAHVEEPAREPRRVLTEQVVRNDQLRDVLALALEHDSGRVRLEEYNGTIPIFGSPDVESYEYRGGFFDVRKTVLEE